MPSDDDEQQVDYDEAPEESVPAAAQDKSGRAVAAAAPHPVAAASTGFRSCVIDPDCAEKARLRAEMRARLSSVSPEQLESAAAAEAALTKTAEERLREALAAAEALEKAEEEAKAARTAAEEAASAARKAEQAAEVAKSQVGATMRDAKAAKDKADTAADEAESAKRKHKRLVARSEQNVADPQQQKRARA